jgi:desulfoferrodoxin (superoxide reductase-like protein)
MKNIILLALIVLFGCNSMPKDLVEVKGPFDGKSFKSNNRFFRAVASGESQNLETSKSKAQLIANQRLASAVQTEIKMVSESYQNERNIQNNLGDFGERFQQLTREVLSRRLDDVKNIGEKTYVKKDKNYITWIALEMHKKDYYKRLKNEAKENAKLTEKEKKLVEEMIDDAIKKSED